MPPPQRSIGRVSPARNATVRFLSRFNGWMQLPIVVSAILPLVMVPESGGSGRRGGRRCYLAGVPGRLRRRTPGMSSITSGLRLGGFDLFVVIATAP